MHFCHFTCSDLEVLSCNCCPCWEAWASTKPLVTSFRPAKWGPMVLELLGDSGTRAGSWNPAAFLAKHYPSATGLSLTKGVWVSFKQKKTRNLANTQANLFANVPLLFHARKATPKQPSSIFTIFVFHLILLLDAQEVHSCYQSIHLSKALLCGLNTFVYCTRAVFSLKGQLLYQLFL